MFQNDCIDVRYSVALLRDVVRLAADYRLNVVLEDEDV